MENGNKELWRRKPNEHREKIRRRGNKMGTRNWIKQKREKVNRSEERKKELKKKRYIT